APEPGGGCVVAPVVGGPVGAEDVVGSDVSAGSDGVPLGTGSVAPAPAEGVGPSDSVGGGTLLGGGGVAVAELHDVRTKVAATISAHGAWRTGRPLSGLPIVPPVRVAFRE